MRKRTHEEFIKLMQNTHPNIEVLGTYVNSSTKIKCRCQLDGHIWETRPNDLLRGHGCPKCKGRNCTERQTKTHEQFLQELYKINQNIEVLGTYVNADTKIKCKCKIDGYEWSPRPSSLLIGQGCPICGYETVAQKKTKTHEQFIKDLQQINPDIEIIGTYINGKTTIKCRCRLDGHEWEALPGNLLRGQGCRKCGAKRTAQNNTKTHEQFIQELKQKNEHYKDIQILGKYINTDTPIKCKCKICGHEWEAYPHNLLRGTGCRKCKITKETKTHEEFMKELEQKNKHYKNIEILGTYKNNNIKIKVKCKVCGYEWEVRPVDLLRGSGCPICGIKQRTLKQTKTHEEFMKEFYEINEHAKDIQILGTYKNRHNKIKCKCKIDGHIWEPVAGSLLNGQGCPICANKKIGEQKRKTHEQFLQELHQINQDIEILGTYVNAQTKIKVKCKIDGHIWKAKPNGLLQGHGCPKCGGTLKKTHEQFIQELEQVNPDIEILGTYVNYRTKILCKCKIDGYEWEATPGALLYNLTGCPKCSITKGEKRVAQYLDNLGIDYIYNKGYFTDLVGTGGGIMQPDFIIPSLKIWIEYDGIQHFEPVDFTGKMSEEQVQAQFKKVQQNDQIKNKYAQNNNWTLIRIPYWDMDNIEQILDSYLKQEQAI